MYINTEDQVVEVFKKAFDTKKLCNLRRLLGVLEMDLSLRGSIEKLNP